MAYAAPRQRQPWSERLPDGRSIDEVVASLLGGGMPMPAPVEPLGGVRPAMPAPAPATPINPIATQPGTAPTTMAPGSVHVGTPAPSSLNTLGRKLAEYRTLQDADIGNKVKRTDWGYEEMPPPAGGPSRLKEALRAVALGAAVGAQGPTDGAAWRALGGAATGGATGAISPRLIQAFTREQEKDAVRGDIQTEQQMGLRNAQINETNAQAEQRRNQPELEALKLERLMREDEDQRTDRRTRSDQAAEANVRRLLAFRAGLATFWLRGG